MSTDQLRLFIFWEGGNDWRTDNPATERMRDQLTNRLDGLWAEGTPIWALTLNAAVSRVVNYWSAEAEEGDGYVSAVWAAKRVQTRIFVWIAECGEVDLVEVEAVATLQTSIRVAEKKA